MKSGDIGCAHLLLFGYRQSTSSNRECVPDDRWLSGMAKAVFRAGFVWKIVEAKWEGTEAAFQRFDPHEVAFMSDDDLDVLLKDERIIRYWKKLKAIRTNAQYVVELAAEHGSAARRSSRARTHRKHRWLRSRARSTSGSTMAAGR